MRNYLLKMRHEVLYFSTSAVQHLSMRDEILCRVNGVAVKQGAKEVTAICFP
jgi:hypothetical protein